MSKFIISIILIVISAGAFFGFIDPTYTEVQVLDVKKQELNSALNNFKEIRQTRDSLLEKRKNISSVDIARLKRFVPDHVDNVRLVMELDNIAARYGMSLKNVKINSDAGKGSDLLGVADVNYGTLDLDLTVVGSYGVFVSFLRDLEKSLRIIDVKSISLYSGNNDFYEYNVGIQTYWLK